jgi:hypothetical protein
MAGTRKGASILLFLGQPSLVRGYYHVYNDCRADANACAEDVLDLLFGSRIAVTSAGVGARINLFGYAIAEINYVNAFELDGWRWQFAIQPGF